MKIRPVGAEFFHTDRQMDNRRDRHTQTEGSTDRHGEVNSRLSQFCDLA